jgi:hypothetical protein
MFHAEIRSFSHILQVKSKGPENGQVNSLAGFGHDVMGKLKGGLTKINRGQK